MGDLARCGLQEFCCRAARARRYTEPEANAEVNVGAGVLLLDRLKDAAGDSPSRIQRRAGKSDTEGVE